MAARGCDIAQGYLFSRPIEAEAVSAVLTASVSSEFVRPRAPLPVEQDATAALASAS